MIFLQMINGLFNSADWNEKYTSGTRLKIIFFKT